MQIVYASISADGTYGFTPPCYQLLSKGCTFTLIIILCEVSPVATFCCEGLVGAVKPERVF